MKISMTFYIILFLIIMNLFLPMFMSSILMIDTKYYINYLLWINILGVLYLLLPKNIGNMFD